MRCTLKYVTPVGYVLLRLGTDSLWASATSVCTMEGRGLGVRERVLLPFSAPAMFVKNSAMRFLVPPGDTERFTRRSTADVEGFKLVDVGCVSAISPS